MINYIRDDIFKSVQKFALLEILLLRRFAYNNIISCSFYYNMEYLKPIRMNIVDQTLFYGYATSINGWTGTPLSLFWIIGVISFNGTLA